MKLVLLAIGMVFSVVSTNAWASGCNPNDSGSEVLDKMDAVVSGTLSCTAGELCVFELSGSGTKLYGTELSAISGSEVVPSAPARILFEKTWGSCTGNEQAITFYVIFRDQVYSGKLSSYSGF